MYELIKIDTIKDKNFPQIYSIYLQSFPFSERRTYLSINQILKSNKKFNILAIVKQAELLGFINYWNFDKFCFVEHFAIKPEFRNNNVGSECFKMFIKKCSLPIILEVELPNILIAQRRIAFYKKLGFILHVNEYQQPPYDGILEKIPMQIMSTQFEFTDTNFEFIKKELYTQVYNISE